MEISFINKQFLKLTNYTLTESIGMKINQLMPLYIAENHHKFIEKYFKHGKN